MAPDLDAALRGFRFERIAEKPTVASKMKTAKEKALGISPAKDKDKSPKDKDRAKKKSHAGDDSQPRVLVERKELQALQSERRALFGRIDEAAAEARELRGELTARDEALAQQRVVAAQQEEVWARHDALRCEERDTARAQAEQAEQRARAANEARAAAEADRTRLREQLAISEAENRRAVTEATRATQQLIAAQSEGRKADEAHTAALAQLRDELGRERERAAAAEARARELEPDKEALSREVAALGERLTGALAEKRALEEQAKQAEEMRGILRGERDAARERAEAADARADKLNHQRAVAVTDAQQLRGEIGTLEAAVAAAAEQKAMYEERLKQESAALKTHVEYAETRAREAERRRDALVSQLDKEREQVVRAQACMRCLPITQPHPTSQCPSHAPLSPSHRPSHRPSHVRQPHCPSYGPGGLAY